MTGARPEYFAKVRWPGWQTSHLIQNALAVLAAFVIDVSNPERALEIRDPVHGSIDLDSRFVRVIDSPFYQRLRQIKQLGFSEFSFPGATHNRYIHSIGVYHLAGQAFRSLFKDHQFSSERVRERLKNCFQLAALLHDIGHGPLSHTTEVVMPPLKDLHVSAYQNSSADLTDRQANHEDYTIKIITDSELTAVIDQAFAGVSSWEVACLIDRRLKCEKSFFIDNGLDFRPILSQLVSSELDVDRMDYLVRDSYFCGTNYGKVELTWLLANLTFHVVDQRVYLAINRRALYTFDDFLISRHHMHLMVYFHHKSIIYEEMLCRYLSGPNCSYSLPARLEDYLNCNDHSLYQHLAQVDDPWARRIFERRPYKVLVELHSTEKDDRPEKLKALLKQQGFDIIHISSETRISKYHDLSEQDRAFQIYVVDQYDRWDKPIPIEECTQIFKAYEGTRNIDRIYISPEDFEAGEKFLSENDPFTVH